MSSCRKSFAPFFFLATSSWGSWAVGSDGSAAKPLEEVVVTATRFSERVEKLPIGVSVINAEQIRNSAASSLPELLQQLAGVHTRNVDGSPDPQIDMRGFGITGNQNTLVLLDGQRINENELVGIRWSTIPLGSIERIEVLRSSGAVTYGGGATGGVINIVTRAATPGGVSGSGAVSLGSYSGTEFNGALNVAGKNLGLALTGNALETENYRVNNALRQMNLQGDLRYQFATGRALLKFGLDDQKLELPATRTEAQLQTDRRGTSTPRDFSTRDGAYITLRGEHSVGWGDFAADLSFRNNHRTALFDDYSIDFFNSKSFLNSRSAAWLFNPRVKLPFRAFEMNHELILGANLEWWDYRSKRFSGSEIEPGAASADILQADVAATQQNRAIYLQHASTLHTGTVVTVGGRLQGVENRVNDHFNSATHARDRQSRMVYAYDAGIRQPVASAFSFYGKFGRSFRIATVDENYNQFGGPAFDSQVEILEPQTAHIGELGVDYQRGPVLGRASLYRINLDNEISFINIDPFLFFANINLPPTRRQGFELEGSWAVTSAFDISGNYTFADARFREGSFGGMDVSGNMIPLVPRHRAAAGGTFRFARQTRVAAMMNYVGDQVMDNDQANTATRRMPDYVTVDIKITHQMSRLLLSMAVNNLFDEKYFSYAVRNGAGTSFNALPARERNVWFTVKYQFD
ncbi:MAG: TonB-dependent receptor [Nitrosospira sp.]|nr:TonB-dependent receptor [Nitrosospira sp.]